MAKLVFRTPGSMCVAYGLVDSTISTGQTACCFCSAKQEHEMVFILRHAGVDETP
jgi:hypothetical protein